MIRRSGLLALLITLLLVGHGAAQDVNTGVMYIVSQEISDDDVGNVTVEFVVRDDSGLSSPDLAPGNITISEETEDVSLSSDARLPLTLAVVVDMSLGGNAPLIRDTLTSFFQYYYRDGDTIRMYVLDGPSYQPRIIEINSAADAQLVIDGLLESSRFYLIENTLSTVLNDLIALGQDPINPRHVLYVGPFLTAPREATLSTVFAQNGIPFHVVQAHRGRSVDDLRQLAINGGGIYANNDDGTLLLEDGTLTPINNLKVLYDAINNTRLVYTLSYRTLNRSLDMFRVVVITATLGADTFVSEAFGYNWEFLPPEVAFVNPNNLTIQRTPTRSGGELSFGEPTQDIDVSVSFIDGVPRNIRSLRLEVINTQSGSVQQSALELNPEVNSDGNYTVAWSLDEFNTPDSNNPVTITITAVDELGISGSTTQVGQVNVAPLPATPTPPATITPIPTATLTSGQQAYQSAVTILFSNTIVVDQDGNPVDVNQDGDFFIQNNPSANRAVIVMLIIVALMMILLVFVFTQLLRQRQIARSGAMVAAPEPEPKPSKDRGAGSRRGADSDERFAPQGPDNRAQKLAEPVYDRVVSDETAKGYVEGDELPEGMEYVTDAGAVPVATDPNEGVLARLVVKTGYEEIENLPSRLLVIRDAEYTIGRGEGNVWVVQRPIVSPKHARIKVDGDRIYIRDLGSKNGTYVNGERVREGRDTPVPVGSEIGITKDILLQIYAPDDEIDYEAMELENIDIEDAAQHGIAVFKPLPGLVYAEDPGPVPSDEYDPLSR